MALTKVSRGLLSTSIEDNGNATAITIDSSENVGIGVVPESWTYFSPLQAKRSSFAGSDGQTGVGYNWYFDGAYKYIANDYALAYQQNATSGVHSWSTAASGTADNTISWSERMRIDSSGNVSIGTSATSAPLRVNVGTDQNCAINTSGGNPRISAFNDAVTASVPLGFNGSILKFETGGSERMRIDSSGNLLVGTSSTSVTNAHGIQMLMQVGATKPRLNIATSGYTSADYPLSLWSTAVSAWRFYVQADGRISAVYTAINSLSDERVKENIRDLDDGLSKVMQLQPRKFDWKEGKGKNITNDRGFIAQEFEQVFPDLVSEWKDEAPEGEEPYKSVSADLIPTLVKAIQEQQTLIESLTARIAALEE